MTDDGPGPDRSARPADAPGERRLERPPSDRYRTPAAPAGSAATAGSTAPADAPTGSTARGIAYGTVAALAGAAAIVVLGGLLAVSAGLLIIAVAMGYAVAVAMRAGAGISLASSTRPWIATALAAAGTILGFVGVWVFARAEGGVLPLPDYLGEVFGLIVPLQLLLAIVAAWWTAR